MAAPLDARATFLLSQLGYRAAVGFGERLAPLGLRPRDFGVLSHLALDDGRTQQQLADAMGIHRNQMVGLVDGLEALGLVARGRHPADRRAHALHITPAARDLLPRAERVADEHEERMLATLDDDERRQLIELLQRLAGNVGLTAGVHPGLSAAEPPRRACRRSHR